MFVLRIGDALADAGDPCTLKAWATAFRAGCGGIQSLGGGKAGDRTMLDALLPAAAALEDGALTGQKLQPTMSAAIAAEPAAVATPGTIPPRLGRHAQLCSHAIGTPPSGPFRVHQARVAA